jgi:hypothetical protein
MAERMRAQFCVTISPFPPCGFIIVTLGFSNLTSVRRSDIPNRPMASWRLFFLQMTGPVSEKCPIVGNAPAGSPDLETTGGDMPCGEFH